jgi:hypothetical protein
MTSRITVPGTGKPQRAIMQVVGTALKWALYVFLGLIGLLILVAIIGPWAIEMGWYLAFGWIHFIVKNAASVELNWVLLAEGIACTVALGIGTHYFCRWLYREASAEAKRAWRWQWTASGLAVVLLLFVAGIGTIGAVHQVAWLFTADEVLLVDSMTSRARTSEAILAGSVVRTAVQEYYDGKGRLPQNSEEAGVANDSTPASRLVASVEIREKGVVVVTLRKTRDWPEGSQITLTPTEDATAKKLSWKCGSTLPRKLLPGSCRE